MLDFPRKPNGFIFKGRKARALYISTLEGATVRLSRNVGHQLPNSTAHRRRTDAVNLMYIILCSLLILIV